MLKKLMASLALLVLPVSLMALQSSMDVAPEASTGFKPKTAVTAEHFMISAANPLAVETGYKILKAGGSAVDAMIATQTVLGLTELQSSGLGGGGFLVYYDAKQGKLTTYDGRETAPLAATPELFQDKNGKPLAFFDAVVGGLSVATPGTVKLMGDLHTRYGKKPWAELLEPAKVLAEKGFAVSPRLAELIKLDQARLKTYPDTRRYFFDDKGKPLTEGTIIKNPAYANTLEILQKQGAEAFYQGAIAKEIAVKVQHAKGNPGLLSKEDFTAYRTKERPVVCSPYREYDICGMGPPSSGVLTVNQILGIIENAGIENYPKESPQAWQIIGDATRWPLLIAIATLPTPTMSRCPKAFWTKTTLPTAPN